MVFNDQNELKAAFEAGELNRDCVVVVRFQGPPRANGMPELHKLTPPYLGGVLQDRGGYKVGLVTDGRMSGASGKVPAAIHVYPPEALDGGPLARVEDGGDTVILDARNGTLSIRVEDDVLAARRPATMDLSGYHTGYGRELFGWFRRSVSNPEQGASFFWNHEA